MPVRGAHAPMNVLDDIIYPAVDEFSDDPVIGITVAKRPDAPLFGGDGPLDSLALVALVVAVEERIEDLCGVAVSLVSDEAMSKARSPFRTLATLTAYVETLIADAVAV